MSLVLQAETWSSVFGLDENRWPLGETFNLFTLVTLLRPGSGCGEGDWPRFPRSQGDAQLESTDGSQRWCSKVSAYGFSQHCPLEYIELEMPGIELGTVCLPSALPLSYSLSPGDTTSVFEYSD